MGKGQMGLPSWKTKKKNEGLSVVKKGTVVLLWIL
jgi:hypothetical protein